MSFYNAGDLVEYTGESEVKHGVKWFEVKILDGYQKGKLVVVSKCPDCGLCYYQSKPAAAPCFTCTIDPVTLDEYKNHS